MILWKKPFPVIKTFVSLLPSIVAQMLHESILRHNENFTSHCCYNFHLDFFRLDLNIEYGFCSHNRRWLFLFTFVTEPVIHYFLPDLFVGMFVLGNLSPNIFHLSLKDLKQKLWLFQSFFCRKWGILRITQLKLKRVVIIGTINNEKPILIVMNKGVPNEG